MNPNDKLSKQEEKKNPKKHQPKDMIRSPSDNFKHTNIQIIGAPEGEEKEQEIENLFEKKMKENFPNLVKKIDIQVQEAQSPKQDGCKEAHSKTALAS